MTTSSHPRAPSAPPARRLGVVFGAILWVSLMAPMAVAQITVATDDASDPDDGSLREQVENASNGATIDVRLGAPDATTAIELEDTLIVEDDGGAARTLEIDNSSSRNGFVEIVAPDSDTFLEIEDLVTLTLRDVELEGNGSNSDDDIDLDGAGATLVLDVERRDQLISVDVIGTGSLVKEGEATLELSGDNTFSGGITIDDGDLVGDADSFGSGDVLLDPEGGETARLVFDFAGTDGFAPVITDGSSAGGEVGIVKRGSGTLDVSAATIDGSIDFEIEDGTVVVGDALMDRDNDFEIEEDGELQIFHSLATTSASELSGEGQIETVARATDVLSLVADPSGFTGELTISIDAAAAPNDASTVRVAPTSAPANGLVFDVVLEAATSATQATTFELQDDFGIAFSGNVSGTGDFTKSGSGTTTLSGTHTQTGDTNVRGGTLVANTSNLPGDVFLANGTTLEFAQGFDATWANTINDAPTGGGVATVRKTGAGTLTLSAQSPFAGDFLVRSGGLHLRAGAGLTNAGLTIGNAGATGAASLSTDFDASPAPPAGVNDYGVGGDLVFEPDATLTVGISATPGVNTRITATGNVVINATTPPPGGTADVPELVVQAAEGNYTVGQTWDVLVGSSITPGVDFDIQGSLFFFDFQGADFGGNTYRLTVVDSNRELGCRTPVDTCDADYQPTSNQQAVGDQLDTFRTAPPIPPAATLPSDIVELQQALTSLTTQEAPGALDSVSPDDLGSGTTIALAGANRAWRGLSDRLALIRQGRIGSAARDRRRPRRVRPSVSAAPREAPAVAAPPAPDRDAPDWQAWLEGQAIFGELGAGDSGGGKEIDYVSGGPILGADRRLGDHARLGFAFSGGALSWETTDGSGEGEGETFEGTLYGAWLGDPVQVVAGARYAFTTIDTDRTITIGSSTNTTSGELEGDVFGAYLELTGSLSPQLSSMAGGPIGFDVAPVASVAYTHLAWGSFAEGGGSPLAVLVDEQEVDSAATALGLRITAERAMEEGVLFRPRLKALWVHEWADVEREVSGTFASAPTTGTAAFSVSGAEMPRDHAELGVGWEVGFAGNANLFFDWQGRFAEDLVENAISVGGRVVW